MNEELRKAVDDVARKAFAFDAMVAAGRISKELAAESLALADGPIESHMTFILCGELHKTHRANHDALVIRLGEVTTLAESRRELLQECRDEFAAMPKSLGHDYGLLRDLNTHLKAADHG